MVATWVAPVTSESEVFLVKDLGIRAARVRIVEKAGCPWEKSRRAPPGDLTTLSPVRCR